MSDQEFTRLAQAYGDTVFRVAFQFLKSRADAEDVTQTVLLRLFQQKKPFESDEHVKHWLIRVAANESKRLLCCAWRRKTEPLEDYAQTLSLPSREHSDLFYAVMALPVKYRVVIYLYYYEDYPVEEVARLLGRNRSTVQTQLMRARGMLYDQLKEDRHERPETV